MNTQLSCTSNTTKLFKHLDTLKGIQEGRVRPIMVHIAPTNRCQLRCVHCCFANRKHDQELSWADFKCAADQLLNLGVQAFEFTGGGDPLLWGHLDEATHYLAAAGAQVGLITNGVAISEDINWSRFAWVRVSLNTLEYKDGLNIQPLLGKTDVSFCYIWHKGSRKHLLKVVAMAEQHKIPCRITVDCTGDDIDYSLSLAQQDLGRFESDYAFISDFNIDTETRDEWDCRMHMLKPFLFADGYLYSCPSAELAQENNRMVHDGIKICHLSKIEAFYNSPEALEAKGRTCSYCKYAPQQKVLEQVLTETTHNAFA